MPVTVIGYSRKFQTAPYEMEEINFTYSLEAHENAALVIEQLKNLALAHRSPIREPFERKSFTKTGVTP